MPDRNFLYWDANVFLSYLNKIPERIQVIEAVFEEIQNNQNKIIVSSVISKVEVAWFAHEKLNRILNSDEEARIDNLWSDASVFETVEFNDEIAILARGLMREGMRNDWRLRTNDAIHLATAKWVGASEINTYDLGDFRKYEKLIGIPIKEPHTNQPKLFT